MSRVIRFVPLLLVVVGCQLPEQQPALRPLPEGSATVPYPYAELLTRARQQATAATNGFHLNDWTALEDAARNLEQTSRFLPKATDVPDKYKDSLPATATDLGKDASSLRDAATAKEKDVERIKALLTSINNRVREMRLEN
jgi:hypothetical protein